MVGLAKARPNDSLENSRLQNQMDQSAKLHNKVVCQTATSKADKEILVTASQISSFNYMLFSMLPTTMFLFSKLLNSLSY